jgi:nucleoredoxin
MDGNKISQFTEDLGSKRYLLIYSSASWCGPCRRFTPELVKWYKRNKSRRDKFEVIFLSADRSEADMQEYMKDDDMPWPAVEYASRDASPLRKFPEGGIPGLVVLDADGKVVSRTVVDGRYIGATTVLEQFDDLLKRGL